MSDTRTDEQIDHRAAHLYAIQSNVFGPVWRSLWEGLPEGEKEAWRRLARAVRGAVHHEGASGCYPTANQGDKIRELREKHLQDGGREKSFIGAATKPYAEMVLLFEHPDDLRDPRGQIIWRSIGFIIHPDGQYEDLHKSSVSNKEE